MASLIITINNHKQGFDLPEILGKSTVIGTDDSCDIVLSGGEGLSRRHCTITCTEKGFILEDANSTNGTYADEKEVEEPQQMKEGVVYSMGDATMIIAELANFKPKAPKKASVADEAPKKKKEEAPAAKGGKTPTPSTAGAKPPVQTRPLPGRNPARRSKLQPGGAQKKALTDEELQQKAKMLASSFNGGGVSTLYVVAIILLAFYTGMVLYSWRTEGDPVPAMFR